MPLVAPQVGWIKSQAEEWCHSLRFFYLLFVLRAAICRSPDNDGSSCARCAIRNKSLCFIPEGSGLQVKRGYKAIRGMTPVQKNSARIIQLLCVHSLAEKWGQPLSERFSSGHGNAYVFSRIAVPLLTHGVKEYESQCQAKGKADITQTNYFERKIALVHSSLDTFWYVMPSSKSVISRGLRVL